ncbi:MAG: adenylate/guanylate cyclase domain-containing protein [Nitrospinota bacterium]|nr:adenylate/guanylate cyclase domain-containing protein [Nitrospinota bacterium]
MKKFIQLNNLSITVAITILVMVSYLFSPRFMGRLELLMQDAFFNVRGELVPGNEVAIATIDEKSIDKLGRWPWKRTVIADLVDALTEYNVKVFGFDIVFSSPEIGITPEQLDSIRSKMNEEGIPDSKIESLLAEIENNADNDQKLFDALKRSKKAVLGYFFHFSEEGLEHLSEAEMESYLDIVAKSRYSGLKKDEGTDLKNMRLKKAYAVEATIEKISNSTKRMGYFNFAPDLDGSVRKIPLIVKYRDMVELEGEDDYLFPPLSFTVLRKYLKATILIWTGPLGIQKVALMSKDGDIEIPTNEMGEMWINYYGPGGTFPHLSIVDIIERKIPPEQLDGKIVMIGPTATAIEDLRITPFDKVFPGVESHATVIDNIIHQRFLKDPPVPNILIDFISIVLIGTVLFVTVPRLGAVTGGGLALAIAVISLLAHYILFTRYNTVFHTVPPLLETGLAYASLAIYRFIMEEKEKRYIQGAFGQYLSPVVIDQLIKDPAALQLGGQRKELTAFFSDVAGFSTISEKLSPEELVLLLNDYLTAMTDIILKYDGVVDKFEGDAIIAFYGAPLDFEDHAERCCLTAIEMQEKLALMREDWAKEGKAQLRMRIGINTGSMVVGNMGSRTRMDYTMMGDAVNLAARLEGANKPYGTELMVSHYTHNICGHLFDSREIDRLRVVGKQEIITVYELICLKGKIDPKKQNVITLYNDGLGHYKEREWKKAVDKFSEILEFDVNDGPAMTYLERALDFQLKEPPKDWDGVFILTSK